MLEKNAIAIGNVRRCKSLAVAPIYADDNFREEVLMLEKAMQTEGFSVRESGGVRNLIIDNGLDRMVFIACGMLIEGISQNRYSKFPALIIPHTQGIALPVNCAQQGRGLVGGIRGRYDGSTTIVMPSIRGGNYDQGRAWTQIMNTRVILGRMDPTRDYGDVDKNADIGDYLEAIGQPEDGQVGLVAGVRVGDRTLYYTDFFGNNSILKRVHPKLAKSFGIVARVHEGDSEEVEKDGIVSFLKSIEVANGHRQNHVGGGHLYILDSPVHGSALTYEDHTVQVSMRQDESQN